MSPIIQITTTQSGLMLYTAATENLEFYTRHLDNIKNWKSQLEKIHSIFPTSFKEDNYNSYHTQLVINGLLTIAILDLSIIAREIFIAKHTWERLFYAKNGYLVIYETLQTYNKHGKFLSEIASKLNPEMEEEFKDISNQIKIFKKNSKFDSEIKEIRKHTAGHIDSDFTKYYDTLSKINIQKTIETIKDFILIITELQKFSSHLMKAYSNKINQEDIKSNVEIFSKLDAIIKNIESQESNLK